MIPTSVAQMPGPASIGAWVIGSDFVVDSGLSAAYLRRVVAEDKSETLHVPASQELTYEPGRLVYGLKAEPGSTSATLATIDRGHKDTMVIFYVADATHAITFTDDSGDEGLLVGGGDFVLRSGDVLAFRYNATVQRWIEVGRIWASRPYVDAEDPPPSTARLSKHLTSVSNPHGVTAAQVGGAGENHITLLAVETEVTF